MTKSPEISSSPPDRTLGVIFMRLRIAEIDEYAIAHVLGYEAAEPTNRVGDALLISRNDFAQVLGSMRAESAR